MAVVSYEQVKTIRRERDEWKRMAETRAEIIAQLAEELREDAETFADTAKALDLLGHPTMAHACYVAEESNRAVLAECGVDVE